MSSLKAHEKRILKLAKEIAATGRHNGWFHIAMELENKRGEPLASKVLEREPHRSQLDKACDAVRRRVYGAPKT